MARQFDIPCVLRVTVETESDSPTGGIFSKPASQAYAEGWEALFGATSDGQQEASLKTRHESKTLN
jgi:hypothetical protein